MAGAPRLLVSWLYRNPDKQATEDGPSMQPRPKRAHAAAPEKVVVAASGFTSLWALTWIGTEALPLTGGIQGGFAVGSVMASSGLALLWWKTRTLHAIAKSHDPEPEREKDAAEPTHG